MEANWIAQIVSIWRIVGKFLDPVLIPERQNRIEKFGFQDELLNSIKVGLILDPAIWPVSQIEPDWVRGKRKVSLDGIVKK